LAIVLKIENESDLMKAEFPYAVRFLSIILMLSSVTLISCGALPPPSSEAYKSESIDTNESIVYVYRPNITALVVIPQTFLIDGKYALKISNKGYGYLRLKPGVHDITVANVKLTFEAQEGKPSYIYYNQDYRWNPNGVSILKWYISEADTDAGIKDCCFLQGQFLAK